jgi:hypothetical protein
LRHACLTGYSALNQRGRFAPEIVYLFRRYSLHSGKGFCVRISEDFIPWQAVSKIEHYGGRARYLAVKIHPDQLEMLSSTLQTNWAKSNNVRFFRR